MLNRGNGKTCHSSFVLAIQVIWLKTIQKCKWDSAVVSGMRSLLGASSFLESQPSFLTIVKWTKKFRPRNVIKAASRHTENREDRLRSRMNLRDQRWSIYKGRESHSWHRRHLQKKKSPESIHPPNETRIEVFPRAYVDGRSLALVLLSQRWTLPTLHSAIATTISTVASRASKGWWIAWLEKGGCNLHAKYWGNMVRTPKLLYPLLDRRSLFGTAKFLVSAWFCTFILEEVEMLRLAGASSSSCILTKPAWVASSHRSRTFRAEAAASVLQRDVHEKQSSGEGRIFSG